MIPDELKQSFDRRIVTAALAVLITINAGWIIICKSYGPFIAVVLYMFALFLFMHRNDLFAGMITGISGLAINVYELVSAGMKNIQGLGKMFFIANLVLPVLLLYYCCRLYRRIRIYNNRKKML